MSLQLTAQQIIDEHSLRGVCLELQTGDGEATRIVFRVNRGKEALLPDWLTQQLYERRPDVIARLEAIDAERKNLPVYRTVPGTNTKVRVFPTRAAAYDTARIALANCRAAIDEVLGSLDWPIVEVENEKRNAAIGSPEHNEVIEQSQAESAAARAEFAWLNDTLAMLRQLEQEATRHTHESRLAQSGLQRVKDGEGAQDREK